MLMSNTRIRPAVATMLCLGLLVGLGACRTRAPVQQQTQQQITALQEQIRALEARGRLAALKTDLLANRSVEELERQYQDIRQDLEAAYATAQGQARATWEAVKPDLDRLGPQLREDLTGAVQTVDAVIDRLSASR